MYVFDRKKTEFPFFEFPISGIAQFSCMDTVKRGGRYVEVSSWSPCVYDGLTERTWTCILICASRCDTVPTHWNMPNTL